MKRLCRRPWRLAVLCSAVVLVSFNLPALAAHSTDYTHGITFYQRGDMNNARHSFEIALAKEPPSAELAYWYANTLAGLELGDQAIAQYQRCLSLNPSPIIARYCRSALAAYGIRTHDTAGTQQQKTYIEDGRTTADHEVEKLRTIVTDGLRDAAALRREGARQIRQMNSETVSIYNMADGEWVQVPAHTPDEIKAVHDQYERRAQAVEQAAQRQAQTVQQEYKPQDAQPEPYVWQTK